MSHYKQGTPYKSHDSHMTEEDNTPDTQIQNRFRGLINELDPDDKKSDSDDSSILDYLEWERILDPVPSHSQLISHGPSRFSKQNTDSDKPSSSKCVSTSCDESCDQSYDQNSPELEMNGDCESHVTLSSESHDQSWDIAPLRISGPPPPNENGLILVRVSEVRMFLYTHTHTHTHMLNMYQSITDLATPNFEGQTLPPATLRHVCVPCTGGVSRPYLAPAVQRCRG